MRLVGRVAGSIALVTVVMAFVVAVMIGLGGGFLILAPLGLGVGLVLYYRRSRTAEIGWSGAPATVATAPALVPIGEPRDETHRAARAVNPRRPRMAAVASLARVEARELIASPWLHVGIAFWLVILALFGVVFVADIDRSWLEFFGIATLVCHPFAAFAIVAAHRNRTRSRRDHCDEMFDACPVDGDARTLGHLATAWVGALINTLFILLLFALFATRSPHIYGPLGGYVVAAVLACAVVGAGAVALGVTLGRWAPWGLVPFVAVVAIAVAGDRINGIGEPSYATDRLLATMVATTGIDPIFLPQLWWERLAWLAAISVVVAAIGLLGGRYTRATVAVLGGATVVALVAAVLIVRPATGDADRVADLVGDPVAHSTCVSAGAGVEVCAYEGYEGLAQDTAAALAPVAAAVPDGVLRDVVFVAYYEQSIGRLTAETQDAFDKRGIRLPEDALRLRFNAHPSNFEAVRLRLAARAVGLPTDATDNEWPTPIAGRSQGVIALWLATRGMDDSTRARLITVDVDAHSGDIPSGAIWPGTCHEENQALQWSPSDIEATRRLFAIPDEQVQQVLLDLWDELTSPDATTDELLAAVGAQPLGFVEPVDLRHDSCV
jgi:hypothetical protein